jgi:hypothetical protein
MHLGPLTVALDTSDHGDCTADMLVRKRGIRE